MSKILDKVADAGGFLYFLLVAVGYIGLVAPFLPESLDSPEAVHAHLTAHPPTTSFWVGVWMEAVGLAFLVVLAARIAARIRAARPGDWLPAAAVGLAVAGLAVKVGSFAPALAALHVDRYDPATVTALLDINDAAYGVSSALNGALLLLLGLGALATRALPRWLAWLGVVAGVARIVAVAVPALSGVLQFAFLAWLLLISGWLLARGSRPARPAREGTAAGVLVPAPLPQHLER